MASSRPDWHYGSEVRAAVDEFYHANARQPDSAEAKQDLLSRLDVIRPHLEQHGAHCRGFEYVGGTFEGVKVSNGLEFDVLVKIDGRGFYNTPTGNPEYHHVRPHPGIERLYLKPYSMVGGAVTPEGVARKFQGWMAKLAAGNSDFGRDDVVFRKHGPAIQMDVLKDKRFWYSADLVPTFEIKGQHFVAKPGKNSATWLHSFSVPMKDMFDGMDRDNGCRKQVLRICKALCSKEPGLQQLSSHHLKMALFAEIAENPNKSWKQSELAPRVLDMFKHVEKNMEKGEFPHFFLPDVDMIGPSDRETFCRMKNLYNKQEKFLKAMAIKNDKPGKVNDKGPTYKVNAKGTTDKGTTYNGTSRKGTTDKGTTDKRITEAGTSYMGTRDKGTTVKGTTDKRITEAGTSCTGTTDKGTTDNGTPPKGTTIELGWEDYYAWAEKFYGTTDNGTTNTGTSGKGTTDKRITEAGTSYMGTTDKGTTDKGTQRRGTIIELKKFYGATDNGTTNTGTSGTGTTDKGTFVKGTSSKVTTNKRTSVIQTFIKIITGKNYNYNSYNKGTTNKGTSHKGTLFKRGPRKGTTNKGTSFKGTKRKGTTNKGTSFKGTKRKGTTNKGTSFKGTKRKGTKSRRTSGLRNCCCIIL